MCEVRLAGKIAFELHPVKALDILFCIGVHESVQFAIGEVIQIPAVRSDVLNGIRKLYAYVWIVRRNNGISLDLTFGGWRLGRKKGREANQGSKLFDHEDLHSASGRSEGGGPIYRNDARVFAKYPGQFYRRNDENRHLKHNSVGVG